MGRQRWLEKPGSQIMHISENSRRKERKNFQHLRSIQTLI
jgi:hypothetical protein